VTKKIEDLQVDGDLLLLLTEKNLQQDLGVNNAITRKRFYCYWSHLSLLSIIVLWFIKGRCRRALSTEHITKRYHSYRRLLTVIRLDARLQPKIGFTFERAVTVFTRSDITPPKVNRFG